MQDLKYSLFISKNFIPDSLNTLFLYDNIESMILNIAFC